jgi:hypothetical protein
MGWVQCPPPPAPGPTCASHCKPKISKVCIFKHEQVSDHTMCTRIQQLGDGDFVDAFALKNHRIDLNKSFIVALICTACAESYSM